MAGEFKQAIDAYREYVEMTNAKEAHLGIAESLLPLGRPQEAIDALDAGEVQSGGGRHAARDRACIARPVQGGARTNRCPLYGGSVATGSNIYLGL